MIMGKEGSCRWQSYKEVEDVSILTRQAKEINKWTEIDTDEFLPL